MQAWRDPDDSQNPLNWSKQTKWINVLLISSQTMLSSICSTILAVGSLLIIADFHLDSIYTPNLGVAMYILGLGLGPLWLGPLSEIYGRRVVYLGSFSLFVLFNVGCALAPNLAALAVLRLLAGTCGSAGPTLGGASIGDMFLRKDRGRAQALYSLGPTAGPVLGPLIGAYVVNGTKDWRWLMWLMVIAPAVTVLLSFLFLKETYAPYLLRQKAKKELEADTNDLDLRPGPLFSRSLLRPFQMLIFAPICSVMSLYMSMWVNPLSD